LHASRLRRRLGPDAALAFVLVHVPEPAVARRVHAFHLCRGRDAEQPEPVQHVEERPHGGADPPDDHQDLHDVRREKPPAAAHEQPVRPPRHPVDQLDVLPAREQRGEDDPPRAAPGVQLRRLQRVVELENQRQLVAADEDPRRHEPADHRRPRVDHGAARGDRGEAAEETVADVGHVPVPRQPSLAVERRQRGDAPRQRRRHGGAAHRRPLPVDRARLAVDLGDGGEGPRVEAEPPEPQQEGAEHDQ
ncbi:Os02g0620533, partial [Oryza sativa Japonica Group]